MVRLCGGETDRSTVYVYNTPLSHEKHGRLGATREMRSGGYNPTLSLSLSPVAPGFTRSQVSLLFSDRHSHRIPHPPPQFFVFCGGGGTGTVSVHVVCVCEFFVLFMPQPSFFSLVYPIPSSVQSALLKSGYQELDGVLAYTHPTHTHTRTDRGRGGKFAHRHTLQCAPFS